MIHKGKHRASMWTLKRHYYFHNGNNRYTKHRVGFAYVFMAMVANFFYMPAKGLAPISPLEVQEYSQRTGLLSYSMGTGFIALMFGTFSWYASALIA